MTYHTTTSILEGHTHTRTNAHTLAHTLEDKRACGWKPTMISMAPSPCRKERRIDRVSRHLLCACVCVWIHTLIYVGECVYCLAFMLYNPSLHLAPKWIIQQEYYMWSDIKNGHQTRRASQRVHHKRATLIDPIKYSFPTLVYLRRDCISLLGKPHRSPSVLSDSRAEIQTECTRGNFICLWLPPLPVPEPGVTAGIDAVLIEHNAGPNCLSCFYTVNNAKAT